MIRSDFVSNSSSTSFIVHTKRIDEINKLFPHYHVQFLNANAYKRSLETLRSKIEDAINEFTKTNKVNEDDYGDSYLCPYGALYELRECCSTIGNKLNDVEKTISGCLNEGETGEEYWITSPIDRDEACEQNFYAAEFEGDL